MRTTNGAIAVAQPTPALPDDTQADVRAFVERTTARLARVDTLLALALVEIITVEQGIIRLRGQRDA